MLCLCPPLASAKVIHVNGILLTDPPPDGLSWTTAFNAVQTGIDAAGAGDEVWVAAAAYFENITLKNGVALYGGFDGTETGRSQRDWTNNVTILDGRQSNSVIVVEAGATNTTRIDGFLIRNGNAGFGGGILCANASPEIVNNIITRNQAAQGGGGIRCLNSAPLIVSNLIQENIAGWTGGGIECVDSAPVIRNNRLIGNFAHIFSGGGIYCSGTYAPQIANNIILGNSVTDINALGGGGVFVNPETSPKIVNNTIVWNQATRAGGIYCSSNLVTVVNNIVAYGSSGITGQTGLPFVFNNNCIFGNGAGDFTGFPNPTGTNGNISADPQFTSTTPYADVHLAASSPCRDAGDGAPVQPGWTDIDGLPRIEGATVDMGASEFRGILSPFAPVIVHVSVSGNDANDGSSWAKAKRSVQAGIDTATLSGGEVWVQSGTYPERIGLRHFVYLFGGFRGNETNRDDRDWKANPTTLDGGYGGSVVNALWLQTWNTLDGFIIQNGRATNGAGIFCKASSLTIANNQITANVATNVAGRGGAIYCSARTFITNNLISLNKANLGGGVYCERDSTPLIANNILVDNFVTPGTGMPAGGFPGGGGVCVDNSSATIANNFFIRNVATNLGSRFAYGGAICCEPDVTHSVLVANNTLLQNTAVMSGGSETGGAAYSEAKSVRFVNNLIALGSSGIKIRAGSSATFHNNCAFGNRWFDYDGIASPTGTNGNIAVDPLLISTNDLHLGPGSPCVDAGDNSALQAGWIDLDGQARRAGAHIDIGADEFGSTLPFVLNLLGSQAGGQRLLRLTGEAGRTYVFESSSDLASWAAFSTNLATNATLEISDSPASGFGERFYRALALP
jgi:parallel beta helix pectate lyase-like protein